jgi:hypothetical protein
VLADGRIALIVDCDKLAALILNPTVGGVGGPPAIATGPSIDQPDELAA